MNLANYPMSEEKELVFNLTSDAENETRTIFGNLNQTEQSAIRNFNDSFDYGYGLVDDVFGYSHVRNILIAAYSIVFLCCFFGNLTVITVICLHRRMRTATNFFLANLAFADICVGIFCVYQNLLLYLTSSWALGDFLCRMYHFVHGLSYTASILILMVISVERYIVIVHTLWGRRFITLKRLKIVLAFVWILSAIYNCPRLFVYGTVQVPSMSEEDGWDTLCVLKRSDYNNKNYDLYNFVILFAIPVLVIIVLYIIIGSKLWKSGESFRVKRNREMETIKRSSSAKELSTLDVEGTKSRSLNSSRREFNTNSEEYQSEPKRLGLENREIVNGKGKILRYHRTRETSLSIETNADEVDESDTEDNNNRRSTFKRNLNWVKPWRIRRGFFGGTASRRSSNCSRIPVTPDFETSKGKRRPLRKHRKVSKSLSVDSEMAITNRFDGKKRLRSSVSINSARVTRGDWSSGTRVLRMRRRIIRLLVVIVLCFVICNLPYHARKFWQNWSPSYDGTSRVSIFFTIATTLIFYMNSGINPFVYAFLSSNFRQCIADIFLCRRRKWDPTNLSPLSTGRMGSSDKSNKNVAFKQNSV